MPDHPAIAINGPGQQYLSLFDQVAALVDGWDAVALDAPAPDQVRVFFQTSSSRDNALAFLEQALGSVCKMSTVTVNDQNWAARSQASLGAVKAGRIVVAPPWARPETLPPGEFLVVVRPALGFGSGHHPSTRLALRGLQKLTISGREVLDLGTGSGVPAVAAARLGARHVTALDRDPDAIASARETLAQNGLERKVSLKVADIGGLAHPSVPILLANLTGSALTRSAPALSRLTSPGGSMVLSGILAVEAEAVTETYAQTATLAWRAQEDEWVGMVWTVGPRA